MSNPGPIITTGPPATAPLAYPIPVRPGLSSTNGSRANGPQMTSNGNGTSHDSVPSTPRSLEGSQSPVRPIPKSASYSHKLSPSVELSSPKSLKSLPELPDTSQIATTSAAEDISVTASEHHSFFSPTPTDQEESGAASHFFNSVLSAAQNAASSLAGIKQGALGTNHHKHSLSDTSFFGGLNSSANPDPAEAELANKTPVSSALNDVVIEPIRSAITTLGKGELSLESLGLEPDVDLNSSQTSNMDLKEKFEKLEHLGHFKSSSVTSESDNNNSHEDSSAKRRASGEIQRSSNLSLIDAALSGGRRGARPVRRSSRRESNGSRPTSVDDVKRSSSTASVFSTGKSTPVSVSRSASRKVSRKLSREASDPSKVDMPTVSTTKGSGVLTGFAYANKKRNREFHKIFRSVPSNDYLLDDFSCALSRDILIQGRMYVSERHVCFNSNILGWVTNLIIDFDEIVALEKKTTAGLFPNGILVQTLHARHSFASFISRDSVFDFVMSIWKKSYPSDRKGAESSDDEDEEAVQSGDDDDEEGTSDAEEDESEDESSEIDEIMDVSSDEEFGASVRPPKVDTPDKRVKSGQDKSTDGAATESGAAAAPSLGPATHGPTDPGYIPEDHGEKLLCSEIIPAPLGTVAALLYGEDSSWYQKFLVDVSKNFDLKDFTGLANSTETPKTRKYEYIKPLNAPVGPKQTKCICVDTAEHWDYEDYLNVVTVTTTPDVPSGNAFTTNSRTLLSWAEGNQTKLVLSYWMDWTGKSWIKTAIERGSQSGQATGAKDLIRELNLAVKTGSGKPSKPKPTTKRQKSSTKKRVKTKSEAAASSPPVVEGSLTIATKLFNSVPVPSLRVPLWTYFVGFLVVWSLLRIVSGFRHHGTTSLYGGSSLDLDSERLANMRMEEEYFVWDWINGRAGMGDQFESKAAPPEVAKLYARQDLKESILIAEQRLEALKRGLENKEKQVSSS